MNEVTDLRVTHKSRMYGLLVGGIAMALVAALAVLAVRSTRSAQESKTAERSKGVESPAAIQPTDNRSPKPGPTDQPKLARLAFERNDEVWIYDVQSNHAKRLGEGFGPDISPDGQTVVFTINKDEAGGESRIRLFNLKTNSISKVDSLRDFNVALPRWSHDGTKIAFRIVIEHRTHVGVLDVVSGNWNAVTRDLKLPPDAIIGFDSWAPDDQSILFHDQSNIYQVSLDGNIKRTIVLDRLIPSDEISSANRFQLSKDGRFLLFSGARSPDGTKIYLLNLSEGKLQQLNPQLADASEPLWLPSETEVLFSRGRTTTNDPPSDLCVLSLKTGQVSTMVENASNGSFSTRKR